MIIIGGFVVKGCVRDDFDIDFMIVVIEVEYNKWKLVGDLFINCRDLCSYLGGFVDGKIINMEYFYEVVDKGNEFIWVVFDGVFIVYFKMEGLEKVLVGINVYFELGRKDCMRFYYCMLFI